jgi:predicted nucleotidyltransferase
MANDLLEALQLCASVLEREQIPYVVVGGLANAIWGEPRVTRDVDIKVFIGNRTLDEFEAIVTENFHLQPRPAGASQLVVSALVGNSVVTDFLISIPGYEEDVLRRSRIVSFEGLSFPVCSPEDLVIQKVIADRDKDWSDIEGIVVEQQDSLDQKYIRSWLSQFAEILDRPDWIDRYERIVRMVDSE